VQNAIDSKVSGLAVTPAPARTAVIPVVQKAAQAGIPVVAFNQGIDRLQGSRREDVLRLGRDAGREDHRPEARPGDPSGKTLCVIQAQGSVALEPGCAGVKSAYRSTENLQVNGADLPSVQQTIQSKLAAGRLDQPTSSPWARRSPRPALGPRRRRTPRS
jgi:simple sugar transport system substrate-binding protein